MMITAKTTVTIIMMMITMMMRIMRMIEVVAVVTGAPALPPSAAKLTENQRRETFGLQATLETGGLTD